MLYSVTTFLTVLYCFYFEGAWAKRGPEGVSDDDEFNLRVLTIQKS